MNAYMNIYVYTSASLFQTPGGHIYIEIYMIYVDTGIYIYIYINGYGGIFIHI